MLKSKIVLIFVLVSAMMTVVTPAFTTQISSPEPQSITESTKLDVLDPLYLGVLVKRLQYVACHDDSRCCHETSRSNLGESPTQENLWLTLTTREDGGKKILEHVLPFSGTESEVRFAGHIPPKRGTPLWVAWLKQERAWQEAVPHTVYIIGTGETAVRQTMLEVLAEWSTLLKQESENLRCEYEQWQETMRTNPAKLVEEAVETVRRAPAN